MNKLIGKLQFSTVSAHMAVLLILITVTTIIYSNSFQAPFVFDDFINIVDKNTMQMTNLGYQSLHRAAFEGMNSQRWLPNLSYGLNYYFGGQDVWGYHLVNLVVHILTALVLYGLFFTTLTLPKLGFSPRRAGEVSMIAALIWAVHPLQTNAVTYIVQRMTSMAALFYLAALLCYIRGRLADRAGAGRYIYWFSAFICALLALASKQNSAMLPVMIVAYEFYFLRERDDRPNIKKVAITTGAALLAVFALGWLFVGANPLAAVFAGYGGRDFSLAERLLTQTRVIFHYLSLIVLPLPSRLNLAYDYQISTSLFSPYTTLLATIGIAGLSGLVIFLFRRHRLLSFGLLWFLLNLAIESTVIPLELVFEHRLYLPSSMLLLAFTAAVYRLWTRRRDLLRASWAAVIIALCLFTWQRNTVWATEVDLWEDVVKKSPNLIRSYIYLAWAYNREDRYRETFELFQRAAEKGLEDVDIYNNSGKAAFQLGMADKAVELFEKAIKLDRFHPESHYNLGVAYGELGEIAKARREMALGMELQQAKAKRIN
ncbi:MAG: tetratricopeptide repeat protein [Desulfurivibrionaceae bacterium]|nr:tetratricopeptide repeat protein [Desulfobulbales bacterium]MDT8334559.1 tetratricopeptide repeat protein [Desulfurivibrionaceae bacterium]